MTNPFNRKQPLFLTIPLTILSFSPPAAFAAAPRILVVHSYHQDRQKHGVEMTKGIEEALTGADCDLRYSRMDIKRHDSEAWKWAAGLKARQILAEYLNGSASPWPTA